MENSESNEESQLYSNLQIKKSFADKFSRDEKVRAFDSIFDLCTDNF